MSTAIEKVYPMDFAKPISCSLLNIENKIRTNALAWRGQFSPQFVETIIKSYANRGDVILDPFVGSGTVLYEALTNNHSCYGYEVNPSAEILAKIYTFMEDKFSEREIKISEIDEILCDTFPRGVPLIDYFSTVDNGASNKFMLVDLIEKSKCKRIKMILSALLILLDIKDEDVDIKFLWKKWFLLKKILRNLPETEAKVEVDLLDARNLPLINHSIDFILTSPPYINVFNYHHNYRKSVELVGWNPLISAKSEIGANRKFRQNRFLTVVQYAIDMALALKEMHRVSKETAKILIVVGHESNVNGTAFYNGNLLKEVAISSKLMNYVNTQVRQFKNKFGQIIKEDILQFNVDTSKAIDEEELKSLSRCIGQKALEKAMYFCPNEKIYLLKDAIQKSGDVEASPIFVAKKARMI